MPCHFNGGFEMNVLSLATGRCSSGNASKNAAHGCKTGDLD
jgi:hypothetical protein